MSKTYKVIGRSPTFGHKHGETFEREIPEAQEKRLIQRGSIEEVSAATKQQTTPPPATPVAGKPAGSSGAGKE